MSGTVTTTDDHPFWSATAGEFEAAGKLGLGDRLRTPDGRTVAVVGVIGGTEHRAHAYNLEVAELHTYYVVAGATPVLVHNTGCSGEYWTSVDNLDTHFSTHGGEMGFETQAEYSFAAQDLMCSCAIRRGVSVKVDGDTTYFLDRGTGEFGIRGSNGIVAYFIPGNPEAYFDGQPGVVVS